MISAAALRSNTSFGGQALIPPSYRNAGWPKQGEHTRLVTVIDWKAMQGISGSDLLQGECLCIRCALHRYFLLEGSCESRTGLEDKPLFKRAIAYFADPRKVDGVLFEAAYHFYRLKMDLARLHSEPIRSSVCMYFTVMQAFDLVLRCDKRTRQRYSL